MITFSSLPEVVKYEIGRPAEAMEIQFSSTIEICSIDTELILYCVDNETCQKDGDANSFLKLEKLSNTNFMLSV